MKGLELIALLTNGVKRNKIQAIEACIKVIDTPISVRIPGSTIGVAGNAAYLDMMRRTHKQNSTSALIDSFSPHAQADGSAQAVIALTMGMVASGGGCVDAVAWDGRDEVAVCAAAMGVGEWIVTSLVITDLSVKPEIELLGECPEAHPFPDTFYRN
jgi:hypothetical protein